MDGNTRWRRMLRNLSEQRVCSQGCATPEKALLRSQGGPGAGLVLSTCPVNRLTTFTSQLFRVVLLRRFAPSSSSHRAQLPVWAFHLTLVVITVQLVRVPGFWEGEVGPLRTLQRGSAAKQGAE